MIHNHPVMPLHMLLLGFVTATVLFLLLFCFCSLMVFLIYGEDFLFSMDLAMHRTVRLKHCMGSLHPSFTNREINTVVFATCSSIFNFLPYVLKLNTFKLKASFEAQLGDSSILEQFIIQDYLEHICLE